MRSWIILKNFSRECIHLTFPLPFRSHVAAGNPVAVLATELIKLIPVVGSTDSTMGSLHRWSRHDLNKVAVVSNPDLQEGVDIVCASPTEDPEIIINI